MTIEVILIGKSRSRTVNIESRGGFHTRHVKAPREQVPSIFGDVSIKRTVDETPESTPEPNPVDDTLKALLAEVDELLYPAPRVNTEPMTDACYHYSGYTVKPKATNYDAPAVMAWQRYQHIKSDAEMEYRRKRAKAVRS